MTRVLVADDSATVRALMVAVLEDDPDIRVIGQARDGEEAVRLAAKLRPDVITMDIHMPGMDGLEATKEIMIEAPTPIVIVSSAVSDVDVGLSLDAVRAGALMVLPALGLGDESAERRAELVSMVKAMSQVKLVRRRGPRTPRRPVRTVGTTTPSVVAIATSTGGPAALLRILADLPRDFPLPILVVQHIAPDFVDGLCRWLNTGCLVRVKVPGHGDPLVPGTVYLAPDDRHLTVDRAGTVALDATPPVDGFRPSATRLFESVARVHGAGTLAVILTGMGRDGVAGLCDVRAAGGTIIAQDETTSVVFGMNGQAISEGLADAVLPIQEIGFKIVESTRQARYEAHSRR